MHVLDISMSLANDTDSFTGSILPEKGVNEKYHSICDYLKTLHLTVELRVFHYIKTKKKRWLNSYFCKQNIEVVKTDECSLSYQLFK